MTTPNSATNGGQILTDELRNAGNALLAYLNSHNWGGLVEGETADRFRASLAAVPASEPVALTEHDLGIIRDIDAMASTPNDNWWSKALALGASRIIKNLRAAAPAPVSGMPDLASLLEELRDEYRSVVNSAYCQCDSDDDLLGRVSAALTTDTPNPTGETK